MPSRKHDVEAKPRRRGPKKDAAPKDERPAETWEPEVDVGRDYAGWGEGPEEEGAVVYAHREVIGGRGTGSFGGEGGVWEADEEIFDEPEPGARKGAVAAEDDEEGAGDDAPADEPEGEPKPGRRAKVRPAPKGSKSQTSGRSGQR